MRGWVINPQHGFPIGQETGLTSDSDAGVDGGVPAGTDDDHVVGLREFTLDEQPEHLGETLSQGVRALDDMHAVIARAGSQACQPGQLCRSHGGCSVGGWWEGLWRRLLVLPDLCQV